MSKSEAKRKWNKAKKNEKEVKNCHHFRFEAKWSETEAKNCHHFRSEVQWSETEAKNCHHFRFEANWSETEVTFFSLWCEKSVFCLFSHLKRNENEMKRKQNEKEAKRKIFRGETKRKYALLISLWSEAKNSKRKEAKKNFFRVSVRNGSRFALKRKIFFAKTGAP